MGELPPNLAQLDEERAKRAARKPRRATATAATPPANDPGPAAGDAPAPRGGRDRPQRDQLLHMLDGAELWHSPDREAFASVPIGSHIEHWPLRHREFRSWLGGRFYEETRMAAGSQAMQDALGVLEAQALHAGPCYATALRVAEHAGNIYLDLCDDDWRAVEITSRGWRVIDKAPVKFIRSSAMRPLPVPEHGGVIEDLRSFINVATDADFRLLVAYLVGCLRPRGPYPILTLAGEQGSGKSNAARMIRALIDPNAAPLRSPSVDERALVVSAGAAWMLCFDNVSHIDGWFSDGLCRLSTGGGFATRTLMTDREETVFESTRPILMTGIPSLGGRADLADRSIAVTLPAMPEAARRSEADLWRPFDAARPVLLGALLDAVSGALRDLPSTSLPSPPRMADFALWVTSAERALGWQPGDFMAAYGRNRDTQTSVSIEADQVATALLTLAEQGAWVGRMTELYLKLCELVPEAERGRGWPRAANKLKDRIDRAKPLLRAVGVDYRDWLDARDRRRMASIERTPAP